MRSLRSCILLLLVLSPLTTHSQTPEKSYKTGAERVCAGGQYEIGCGYANGSQVLNVTELIVTMETAGEAFNCEEIGGCYLHIGGKLDSGVTDLPLLNLFKLVQHNCNGKPKCTGTLPQYNEVFVWFSQGAYGSNCGFWEENEHLSLANIVAECVDADTLSTLPPYEYQSGSASPTPSVDTTTTATTTTTTTATTTTSKDIPTAKQTTNKPIPTTTIGKGDKDSRVAGQTKTSIAGVMTVYVVLGAVAGVAALVGVVILGYVLCKQRTTVPVTKSSSVTQYPLNGSELNDVDVNEKQPIS